MPTPAIRLATTADSIEVVRLAAIMYRSMGIDSDSAEWRQAAHDAIQKRLGDDLAIAVADHPDRAGQLLASVAGCITTRLPGPANLTAEVGYIQWVATEPDWRGHGLARAIMTRLLGWYRERGVVNVELHATSDGERVYRSLGFNEGDYPGLRMRVKP